MQNLSIKKIAKSVATIGILMFVGAMVFQIGVAFGWTNPLGNPPTGTGAVGVTSGGQVFVGPGGTTASGTAVLTVNGAVSVMNNIISDLNAPIGDKDAVNKGYVLAQTGGVTVGAGSIVLYYKTLNGTPVGPIPSCPAGWTYQHSNWYGPHYIGVISYDYFYNGSGGSGGGFGGTAPYNPPTGPGVTVGGPPPDPPPAPGGGTGGPLAAGYSYNTNAIAFGSDSVCSQQQKTVVPMNQFYQNSITGAGATWYSDACATSGPNTECNMCVVCAKP
jgi:hypothetical protein